MNELEYRLKRIAFELNLCRFIFKLLFTRNFALPPEQHETVADLAAEDLCINAGDE